MSSIALFVQRAPAFLHRIGDHVADFIDEIGEARTMAHEYKVLSRMSDEELARHGLKRDEIAQAVFANRGD